MRICTSIYTYIHKYIYIYMYIPLLAVEAHLSSLGKESTETQNPDISTIAGPTALGSVKVHGLI